MGKTEKPLIKKSALILSLIEGFLFAFFVRTEADLFKYGNIDWTGKYIITLLVACMAGAVLFGGIYYLIKRLAETKIFSVKSTVKHITSKAVFVVSLVLNLLAFIPFFLAYFPGIMAYDFPIQLEQIVNSAYNNHHPLAHTLLIKGCLVIGEELFKSATVGVAICTFIQLTMLAVSLAFAMYTVNELGSSLVFEAVLQILFCFQFFNGFLSVSITKDVIFTGFVLVFLCSLVLCIKRHSSIMKVLFFISAIGICLFRNNGLYALLVMLLFGAVVFLIQRKKSEKLISGKTFVCLIVSIAVGVIALKTLNSVTNATEGDKREMLSVPIQQLARVAVNEKGRLTDSEQALIDDFLLYNSYENYNPVISDPVKGNANTYVVRYQTSRFVKSYLELFKKYPGDYINAFLCLVGGYVSPFDETYRVMRVDGKLVTRNYIQHSYTAWGYEDYVDEASVLPRIKLLLDDYAEKDKFNIPVLKLFFIPGIYLWIYLWIFIAMVDRRDYRLLIPWIFAMAYLATLFLGPTMNLRYIYPLMTGLPIFIAGSVKHEA